MRNLLIPCQYCYTEYPPGFMWYVCDSCGYRVCPSCSARQKGRHNQAGGSLKCGQCMMGVLRLRHGV